MLVLELAVQAVRGFAQAGRFTLKPGYVLVRPKAPGSVPLCGLVSSLCFSDGRGGDSVYLAPGQKAGKAALSFLGNDLGTYLLTRDLGGAGALHKLNSATRKYEVVTEDATEAAGVLRSSVGLPPKAAFDQIFCFTPSQLPTQRPKSKKAAPVASGPSQSKLAMAIPAQAEVAAATDVAAAEARLVELERELGLTQEVDKLQFRHDGLGSQLFELEGKLKGGDGLKAALREAEAAFAKAPTAESLGLSADILARAERFQHLAIRRDDALARIESERASAEGVPDGPVYVEPVWRDVRFLGGLAGGAIFLSLGVLLEGTLRYAALFEIPAFGFSALLALKYVDDLQASGQASKKGGGLAVREKKVRDEFERESRPVREAMKVAQVESPADLAELLGRKALLGQKVDELKAELEQFAADPEYAQASARHQALKAEQDEVNRLLLEKGGYLRDLREVEREIARTREAIAKARAAAPAREVAAPAPAAAAEGPAPVEAFDDPVPQVLSLGADLLTTDVATLGATLKERAGQFLAAFTEGRFAGVELDRAGKAFAQVDGQRVPAGALPGKDLDLLYLSVRMALVERYCTRFKVPLFVEELLAVVDPYKVGLVGRLLKHLSTVTQVLHVTSNPALDPMADQTVTV